MRTQKRGKSSSFLVATAEMIGSTIGKLASKTGIASPPIVAQKTATKPAKTKQAKTKRVASAAAHRNSRTQTRAASKTSPRASRSKRA